MRRIIHVTFIALAIFSTSAPSIYGKVKAKEYDKLVINKFLPSNAQLVSPTEPKSSKPYQFYDFDQDGQQEIIITYEIKAKDQPNQYGVIVLRKDNERWTKIWETQTQGVGLDYSDLADITGDGIKEYLFGVTIGASAGNKLEIFKWSNNNSLEMIADVPYHMMNVITIKDVGIAVWRRYIADTYFVDVLKWNGEKMILDEELYSKYYPEIEHYYKDKLSKTDAWYYWYTLADAQIKANLFNKAAKSIENGIASAKEFLPEVVENFNQLNDKLIKKRNSN